MFVSYCNKEVIPTLIDAKTFIFSAILWNTLEVPFLS